MGNELSLVKKIGNFVSNILLGETKELIIRTDEKVRSISKTLDSVSTAVDSFRRTDEKVRLIWKTVDDMSATVNSFRSSIATHGANIEALQIHTRYGINNSPTVPNEKGQWISLKNMWSIIPTIRWIPYSKWLRGLSGMIIIITKN